MLGQLIFAAAIAVQQQPPFAPDNTETVISGDHDSIANRCVEDQKIMQTVTDQTVLKVVITKSPIWGTLWRADISNAKGPPPGVVFRSVCWSGGTLVRLLDMGGPEAILPPL